MFCHPACLSVSGRGNCLSLFCAVSGKILMHFCRLKSPRHEQNILCIRRRAILKEEQYMISKRKEMKLRKAAVKQSLTELGQLNAALTASYRNFNSVSDPVVMDACIYEINALRSRRDSILHDIRNIMS